MRVQVGKQNFIFMKVLDLTKTVHTDQTGAFLYISQRETHYIMVGIHLDANYIFVKAMKNRTEGEMIKVYQKMVNRMQSVGRGLKENKLDNKASAAFKQCIKDNNMTYKLAPWETTGAPSRTGNSNIQCTLHINLIRVQ
jgi:hypothetical protein